jgi:TusA-related sulfurtransferase
MAFKKEPATHLRKCQYQKNDIQQIQNKAEAKQKDDKYAKLLFKDCKESLDAIGEIIPVLETMMKKGTSDANVEKVMEAISVMENNIKDLNEWAAKLGYVIVSAKKRRQNKSAAADIEP